MISKHYETHLSKAKAEKDEIVKIKLENIRLLESHIGGPSRDGQNGGGNGHQSGTNLG